MSPPTFTVIFQCSQHLLSKKKNKEKIHFDLYSFIRYSGHILSLFQILEVFIYQHFIVIRLFDFFSNFTYFYVFLIVEFSVSFEVQ